MQTDTPSSLSEKYDRLVKAQKQWKRVEMATRKAMVQTFMALLAEPEVSLSLARIMASETGKPLSQA